MSFKDIAILFFILCFSTSHAQKSTEFGKLTDSERKLTTYAKDSNANALVLYERGDNYFKVIDRHIRLVKEYHVKIKIFNSKGFDAGKIVIPLRKRNNSTEKLSKIKAITHNGEKKFTVLASEIYTNDINQYRKEASFAFPKLEKGSIIEYKYTITSPFFYNFRGWNFQSNIPKIHSEFNAKIPANYVYNRALIGSLVLNVNDVDLKKDCFYVDGYSQAADCEVFKYAMNDIPAFKIEEDYMLAPSNYISRLDFELSQYTSFNGEVHKYTKTWKDVDKEFRGDKNIGRQLKKKGFFENNVPEKLINEGDDLTRAKNIYKFIQEQFNWNEKYGIYDKANVKDAFKLGKGNVSEINMSLINLLNAAGIKTNLMLLSTRNQGLPKKIYPVMSDFNYVVAKITINEKDYLLDATSKFLPFGMLPYRALNHYGRVMDFKNESYWFNIITETNNKDQIRASVKFDIEEQKAFGHIDIASVGYEAVNKRISLDNYSEEAYLDSWEEDIYGDFKITNYKIIKDRTHETQVTERFEYELQYDLTGDMIYFNPFLIRFFDKNPFTLEERNYPVDFGYNRNYKYQINLSTPEGYKIQELPKDQAVVMRGNLVTLKFLNQEANGQIAISFKLAINNPYYTPEGYKNLQEVFKHVIDIQKNSLVIFKKE